MTKPSAYAVKMQRQQAAREYAVRRYTRQQFLDFATVALGRMGYGPKRIKDFEAVLTDVYLDYSTLTADDLKDDAECVYSKACLDRELQQYTGQYFEPYEKRYFDE